MNRHHNQLHMHCKSKAKRIIVDVLLGGSSHCSGYILLRMARTWQTCTSLNYIKGVNTSTFTQNGDSGNGNGKVAVDCWFVSC